MRVLVLLYVAIAALTCWRTDGTVRTKLTLAALWPLAPLAFAVTIAGLLVAAVVAFSAPRRRTSPNP